MEHPEGYPPRAFCSEKISIKDFKSLYSSEVPDSNWLSLNVKEACYKVMVGTAARNDLEFMEKYCSTDQLNMNASVFADVKFIMEKPAERFLPKDTDPNSKLQTHKELKKRKEIKNLQFKYKGNIWMTYDKPLTRDLEPLTEVMIAVRVFRPFVYQRGTKYRREPSLRQEFLVLGHQYLFELRDLIKCVADGQLMKETSENPDQRSTELAKDKYKSGFFFIDGTFYNDQRFPTNSDYSEAIRQWASERNMKFEFKKMEDTRFIDLSVQLGRPYVYQHQGSCEHLIVFSDIRLLSTNDILSSRSYPVLNVMKNIKTRMCVVCGIFSANWLTKNNERVFTHLGYFCDTCFKSFNYIDGKKIGNFLAYPIYQE